jgi:hypothetical protein
MNVGAILLLSGMYLSYVAETHHKTAMDKRMERRGYDVSKPFDWMAGTVLSASCR